MATRRLNPASSTSPISFPTSTTNTTTLNPPASTSTRAVASKPNVPAIPSSTVTKLVLFTIAMFTLPLLSYFASIDALFSGNSSYAGGLAAFMANVVLAGYIIAAVREDGGDGEDVAVLITGDKKKE